MENGDAAAYVPPNSIDAERSVLGSIFLDPKSVFLAIEHLQPSDFYSRRNQLIFDAMCALSEAGKPIDTITVVDKLERSGQLDGADDTVYVADLAGCVPSASSIAHYIEIVEQKSVLRALIGAGNEIIKLSLIHI